jgi:hypothetical protein
MLEDQEMTIVKYSSATTAPNLRQSKRCALCTSYTILKGQCLRHKKKYFSDENGTETVEQLSVLPDEVCDDFVWT